MHKIYLAAIMNYGLGSDDPEELAYYNKPRKEMDKIEKDAVKKRHTSYLGYSCWNGLMNLNTFLLIDGSLMLIGLPLLMILKGKKQTP